MLTKRNYIDLYFKDMDQKSFDWMVPYFLQIDQWDEDNLDGFMHLDDTVSQKDALGHIDSVTDMLEHLKLEISKYERHISYLYNKLSDKKEWTLAVANQTFKEEDEED